jgi:hypothetical protein
MVPIYKKRGKTDFINYRGISLVLTTYTLVSNILLSSITSCMKEITENFQCSFRRNKSHTNQVLCVRQISHKNGNIMGQCVR